MGVMRALVRAKVAREGHVGAQREGGAVFLKVEVREGVVGRVLGGQAEGLEGRGGLLLWSSIEPTVAAGAAHEVADGDLLA